MMRPIVGLRQWTGEGAQRYLVHGRWYRVADLAAMAGVVPRTIYARVAQGLVGKDLIQPTTMSTSKRYGR